MGLLKDFTVSLQSKKGKIIWGIVAVFVVVAVVSTLVCNSSF